MKFKVACIQISSGVCFEKNLRDLDKLFKIAFKKKPKMICLPECVALLTNSKPDLDIFCETESRFFLDYLKNIARKNDCFILVGSCAYKGFKNKIFNRSILIGSSGKLLIHYDKINLFDVKISSKEQYFESDLYTPGKKICVYELPWGKLGFSICYDLRFPNHFKKLLNKGVIFLSIPAAFTVTTGKAHWESLLRARAIENGCYVFAPAQCGKNSDKRQTYGHSMIVDPWGKIISKAKNKPTVIFANINTELVNEVRSKIPSILSS